MVLLVQCIIAVRRGVSMAIFATLRTALASDRYIEDIRLIFEGIDFVHDQQQQILNHLHVLIRLCR